MADDILNRRRALKESVEQGSVNILGAVFIVSALAFLFITFGPLISTSQVESEAASVATLALSADKPVVSLLPDGKTVVAPNAPDIVRNAIIALNKSSGEPAYFCGGVYKAQLTAMGGLSIVPANGVLELRDVDGNLCNLATTAASNFMTAQAAALGTEKIATNPFMVVFAPHRGDGVIIALPAIVARSDNSVSVMEAPNGPGQSNPGGSGPNPNQTSGQQAETPAGIEPQIPGNTGSNGDGNSGGGLDLNHTEGQSGPEQF
ncbi:MAG: hypothetical protein RL417_1366 [Pseudomonadota bacterium]|jgi:hypothetical protein